MSTRLELIAAGAELQPVLENLLELYIHDFTEYVPIDLGDDGRFGYKNLALYWSDAGRRVFLARYDGKWAGFALVKKVQEEISDANNALDMAEFFVLRRYRHQGVGTELAERVWERLPGRWQIRVMADNLPARRFWESSIKRFTGQEAQPVHTQVDGVRWHVFSFNAPEGVE